MPDRLHGRAFAAYNGLRNGAELFALAGGGAAAPELADVGIAAAETSPAAQSAKPRPG